MTPIRRRLSYIGLLLLTMGPAPLAAVQLRGSLDVGTGPARWDQVESEGARVQGTLGGSYRPGRLLGLEPEISGGFGLSTEHRVRTALRWDVTGRMHTRGAVTGAWLGGGLGGVGTGARTAALTRLEGGVRSGIGPAGLRVWLARTSFGVRPGVSGSLGSAADPDSGFAGSKQIVEYTDLGTRAGLDFGRYEIGATLIRRWGSAALQSGGIRSVAWEVSAVWWLRPSVGVVASAGHSLPELSLALPGARYRSLGVRLALGAPPRGGSRIQDRAAHHRCRRHAHAWSSPRRTGSASSGRRRTAPRSWATSPTGSRGRSFARAKAGGRSTAS